MQMNINIEYGVVRVGGVEFRADRRMLQELSCLIPEIVMGPGGDVEKVIKTVLIGPSTDLGKPKNIEVVIVLLEGGDNKYEGRFLVAPHDLNPRATSQQRERNIRELLGNALVEALGEPAYAPGQRHEACERLARRLRGESEPASVSTN